MAQPFPLAIPDIQILGLLRAVLPVLTQKKECVIETLTVY
jgi:hypothetical protein